LQEGPKNVIPGRLPCEHVGFSFAAIVSHWSSRSYATKVQVTPTTPCIAVGEAVEHRYNRRSAFFPVACLPRSPCPSVSSPSNSLYRTRSR
jgi:hypothetical protein